MHSYLFIPEEMFHTPIKFQVKLKSNATNGIIQVTDHITTRSTELDHHLND